MLSSFFSRQPWPVTPELVRQTSPFVRCCCCCKIWTFCYITLFPLSIADVYFQASLSLSLASWPVLTSERIGLFDRLTEQSLCHLFAAYKNFAPVSLSLSPCLKKRVHSFLSDDNQIQLQLLERTTAISSMLVISKSDYCMRRTYFRIRTYEKICNNCVSQWRLTFECLIYAVANKTSIAARSPSCDSPTIERARVDLPGEFQNWQFEFHADIVTYALKAYLFFGWGYD